MSTSIKSKKKTRRYISAKSRRYRDLRSRRSDAQLEVSVTHSDSGAGSPSPTVTPMPLVPLSQSELLADMPEMDSELGLNQSFIEHPSDRDYSQSPVKRPKWAIMPLKAAKSSLHSPPCLIILSSKSTGRHNARPRVAVVN